MCILHIFKTHVLIGLQSCENKFIVKIVTSYRMPSYPQVTKPVSIFFFFFLLTGKNGIALKIMAF